MFSKAHQWASPLVEAYQWKPTSGSLPVEAYRAWLLVPFTGQMKLCFICNPRLSAMSLLFYIIYIMRQVEIAS